MPRTKKRKTAEPLYEVEAIVGRRKDESGKCLYKVHWKVRPGRLTYIHIVRRLARPSRAVPRRT